ncbi:polynucleotide phosphorylase/polyadenylase [Platysternon megacephalum]|uniref:Polynucleotide phosphorylase/polyadenylase n=1 Tax=Platysternon megacephalum TaxID=55544 RepID=A0A4D9DE35_9SAUR|nr:polynucleotide phosphorylase/polyadenylase [Platysternon megacephalum]
MIPGSFSHFGTFSGWLLTGCEASAALAGSGFSAVLFPSVSSGPTGGGTAVSEAGGAEGTSDLDKPLRRETRKQNESKIFTLVSTYPAHNPSLVIHQAQALKS